MYVFCKPTKKEGLQKRAAIAKHLNFKASVRHFGTLLHNFCEEKGRDDVV